MNKRVLGVDCGNVILRQMNGTPVDGALEALQKIVRSGAFDAHWIVSKCGDKIAAKTLLWLKELDFWNITGFTDGNIRFCRTYQEKDPICRELRVTDFVDDRPIVHNCLISVDNLIAFQPKPGSLRDYQQDKPLKVANSWDEVLLHLQ